MRNDSDNGPIFFRPVVTGRHSELFPDGIASLEKAIHHQLIHDDNGSAFLCVRSIEKPAAEQTCFDRLKESGSHYIHFRGWKSSRLRLLHSFREKRGLPTSH